MPTICATACARFAKPSSMPIRPVMSCGWGTPISRPVHLAKGLPCFGYDTTDEEYVWLATKVLKDDRLQHVPYNGSGRA